MCVLIVNARFLTQPMSGVQRFAENVSLELKRIIPGVQFVAPRHQRTDAVCTELAPTSVGRLQGHAWEQFELPRYLASKGSPLLLNLGNTGPLAYGNQIATLHDISYLRFPQSYSWRFRLWYRVLAGQLLKRARLVLTVSEFSKKEIATHYRCEASRICVVPNAAGADFRPSPRTTRQPYLLAVSSPNFHKNFPRVIDAYRDWEHRHQIQLKIVGSQSAMPFLTQRFGELPEGVEFLGRVDDRELIDLYSNAFGFVFPSLYEGFGIPPLEAQACGCPVIASNQASMPEVLRDSVVYFDPYDVASIREAMGKLVQSSDLREQLVEKGFANCATYSWRNSALAIAEKVRRVQGGGSAR